MLEELHVFSGDVIRRNLDLFSQAYDTLDDIHRLRNLLRKCLLTEILKVEEENRDFFLRCLNETDCKLNSRSDPGFPCALIGCRYLGKRHRDYVVHLKKSHPDITNIICNFSKKCIMRFMSVEDLIVHIKLLHSKASQEINENETRSVLRHVIDEKCVCNRLSCGQLQFESLKQFMTHYNSFHANEERPCIFFDCKTVFHASCPGTARNHFRLKHKATGNMRVKNVYSLHTTLPQSNLENSMDSGSSVVAHDRDDSGEEYNIEEIDMFDELENVLEYNESDDSYGYYLEFYSHFLNKLAHFKFIPQTTIQDIVEQHIKITRKTLERQEKLLRKSLMDKSLDSSDIDKILENIFNNDPFLNAQLRMNTEYKRLQYIRENAVYVHPKEILLNKTETLKGKKKEVYHYVSIVDTFRNLIQDPSFLKMVELNQLNTKTTNAISDLKDGSCYANNKFFQQNQGAYAGILYSDAVEIKNPLGSAKGSYKIVQIFYSLCEVDKSQRSKIDRFQLVMVFREKLLKKYSLQKLLKPLIDDIHQLEAGIEIYSPSTRIAKFGILCYVADNLEACSIGGFSMNFSSKDVCRVCHAQYEDLEQDESCHYSLWTIAEYDSICRNNNLDVADNDTELTAVVYEDQFFEDNLQLESQQDHSSSEDDEGDDGPEFASGSKGIRYRCPLNSLQSFHCVESLPLDLMHDLFEGNLFSVNCMRNVIKTETFSLFSQV